MQLQIKPEELYLYSLAVEKVDAFSQLRMENPKGFNWLKTHPTIMRIPHNQQIGHT